MSQLSRELQVLAQLSYTGLAAPKIPIQRLSFMKYKAADQAQDSAPGGHGTAGHLWAAAAAVPSGKRCREQGRNNVSREKPLQPVKRPRRNCPAIVIGTRAGNVNSPASTRRS